MSSCHTTPPQKKNPSAPPSNQLQKPHWRDCRQTHGPGWDTVPHTSQFLPGFVVSLTAASVLAQAAAHKHVETRNCSALRDFGISRGCVCPCLPPPQTLFQSRILVQKMKTSCSCHWLQPFLNRKRQRVLCCSRPTALGRHLMNVGRWSNYPLEKQCWKGDQKKGGWRPASSLGSGQIYGIPQSSGQTGHPHVNDTGFAGSDSTAWVMQEVRLR